MPDLPCLIAEIAPEELELTAGRAVAGLMVLAAMAGSITTIALWTGRLREKKDIFPAASRKPLIVPAPLLIGGLFLTVLMSLMVLATSPAGTEPMADDGVAEAAEDSGADETVPVDGAAEIADTGESAGEADVFRMMIDTLSMNLMMFSVFGLVIWLCQQSYSRKLTSPADLSYAEPPYDSLVDTGAYVATAVELPALSRDSFESPGVPPNPFLETALTGSANPESWCFTAELQFAAEAVLVAYLPTAMLRILILSMLPESPSHPFLEIMEQGINWPMLVLIGVMAIVVAPAVEELLYRVTILGGFMQQNATGVGWIVSSVLFGFAHGFPDSIALLPLAFAIGYTYIRRRSYRTVMLIHLMFNAFNMFIAVISLV